MLCRPSPRSAGLAIAVCLAVPGGTSLAASPAPSPGDVPVLTDLRPVTVPGARLISMSPDGRLLAATRPSVNERVRQLCTVDLNTLADVACADQSGLDVPVRLDDVTWSPDSTRLAFTGNTFRTLVDGDLWVMDAATGEFRTLDDDGFEGTVPILKPDPAGRPVSVPANPAFSPDGSTIAFSRSIIDGDSRVNWMATVPSDGGDVTNLRRIGDQPGIVYLGIAWAPDGQRLYFSFQSTQPDDPRNGVWWMPADGGTPRLATGDYQGTQGPAILDISPDGAWLLYQDPVAMGEIPGRTPVYAVADAEGESVVPLLPGADSPPGSYVAWAAFSPDSRWLLVLEHRPTDDRFVVRVRSIDGSIDEVLVDEGITMAGPIDRGIPLTWSANGTAFLTGAGDVEQGYLLTMDGGTLR